MAACYKVDGEMRELTSEEVGELLAQGKTVMPCPTPMTEEETAAATQRRREPRDRCLATEENNG